MLVVAVDTEPVFNPGNPEVLFHGAVSRRAGSRPAVGTWPPTGAF